MSRSTFCLRSAFSCLNCAFSCSNSCSRSEVIGAGCEGDSQSFFIPATPILSNAFPAFRHHPYSRAVPLEDFKPGVTAVAEHEERPGLQILAQALAHRLCRNKGYRCHVIGYSAELIRTLPPMKFTIWPEIATVHPRRTGYILLLHRVELATDDVITIFLKVSLTKSVLRGVWKNYLPHPPLPTS